MMNGLQLTLFHKYAELLKRRFSEDFQEVSRARPSMEMLAARALTNTEEIVSTDDYMPMAINNYEEYEKVLSVSWITQEKPVEELT